MRMLKTQLVHDLVFIVEPTIRTKVAWARPERAGRKANSKSTCEVQDLRTANALRKRQPSVPFLANDGYVLERKSQKSQKVAKDPEQNVEPWCYTSLVFNARPKWRTYQPAPEG